jgi:translation initiation factor 2 subunit 2
VKQLNYEELLDRAFTQISQLSEEKVDFKIPEADSMIQGSKTFLRNLRVIADAARRDPSEIARYLTKELGTPTSTDNSSLIINAKVQQAELSEKIKKYFEIYIICKECHKPDTHVQSTERGYMTIVCEACGARYTVKNY